MKNQGKSYDNIAEGFAKMRDSFNTEQKYLDALIHYIPERAHILDVGCGSGFPIADYLIKKHFHVTGIDGSQELLNIAKKKCPKMRGLCGDIRTIEFNETVDAIVEWWCLFHLPKADHELMIARFEKWLKPGGILEFTSGDSEYEETDSNMLNQELDFYSLSPIVYEQHLKKYGFEILLKESDQEHHLVWIVRKQG
ncbi:MAG: class I SAM-dependent methyltransferase [Proteobacteria bacterium]|nr:class I SAM-dependent methyltransferase [Pseudomonadota bacterium]